jgi:predicted nucleic acid-binding protein
MTATDLKVLSMIYFDTAYLAKCYLNEHGSDEVRELATTREHIACCAIGRLELASTIHRNFREGKITLKQAQLIHGQFDLDEANHLWTWLPVSSDLLIGAAKKFRSMGESIYLRASDALHLTCAAEHGFKEIFSNDRHLLSAASAFKIKARNIIP